MLALFGVFLIYNVCVLVAQRRFIVQLEDETAHLAGCFHKAMQCLHRLQEQEAERRKQSDAAAAALVDLLAWAVGRPDPIPIDELLAKGQQLLDAAGWAGDYPAGHKAPETAPQQKAGQ